MHTTIHASSLGSTDINRLTQLALDGDVRAASRLAREAIRRDDVGRMWLAAFVLGAADSDEWPLAHRSGAHRTDTLARDMDPNPEAIAHIVGPIEAAGVMKVSDWHDFVLAREIDRAARFVIRELVHLDVRASARAFVRGRFDVSGDARNIRRAALRGAMMADRASGWALWQELYWDVLASAWIERNAPSVRDHKSSPERTAWLRHVPPGREGAAYANSRMLSVIRYAIRRGRDCSPEALAEALRRDVSRVWDGREPGEISLRVLGLMDAHRDDLLVEIKWRHDLERKAHDVSESARRQAEARTLPPLPRRARQERRRGFHPPPDARVTRCRSCRASIIWIETARGKRMPIDADPVTFTDDDGDYTAHESHFATCPNASRHRRGSR